MKLVLLGPPGAGKGTQAERIHDKFQLPHISTGNMLRAAMDAKTPMGLSAKSLIDKGELVPDEVVIGIVKDRLSEDDCIDGFMLDGFPRTTAQAIALDTFAKLDCVLLIDVDFDKLILRLSNRRVCLKCGSTYIADQMTSDICSKCGDKVVQREDDSVETVTNRLNVYTQQTSPLIEYYEAQGKLLKVNGSQPIDKVFKDASMALKSVSK